MHKFLEVYLYNRSTALNFVLCRSGQWQKTAKAATTRYTCAISSGNDYQPEFLMLFSIIFHFSVKTFHLNS